MNGDDHPTPVAVLCCLWGRHSGNAFKMRCAQCPAALAVSVPAKMLLDDTVHAEPLCPECFGEQAGGVTRAEWSPACPT